MISNKRDISVGKSEYGMVSSASKYATEAGVKILELGGNAIDAAVATAFCLGVTEPQASGIGGQSMVLLHLKESNATIALDGSSRAPFAINPNRIPKKPFKVGIQATTVPSTVATLGYLLDNYGTKSLSEVLEPSIIACREGFPISNLQARLIERERDLLCRDKNTYQIYFRNNRPLQSGDILRQTELANCLEQLAKAGWQDFYIGKIGKQIITDMKKRGGLITATDLSQIPIPIERTVLESSYRNFSIKTFPPPGAGRVLVQLLNIFENFSSAELDPESITGALNLALAFRLSLRDRERMPIEPDLYYQFKNTWMTCKDYGEENAKRIQNISSFFREEKFVPPPTTGETTHLSVVDKEGNAVGITQSIELVFGSKTIAQGLGFFYNNYMSAFEYKNITHPYYILPGARPWSSVAPTIVFKEGQPYLILGSPGSERIATTIAQVIIRVLDLEQTLEEAIEAPRLHVSSSGSLSIEKNRFSKNVIENLKKGKFIMKYREDYSFYIGCVQAIMYPQSTNGKYIGVADPRRDGVAIGPKF